MLACEDAARAVESYRGGIDDPIGGHVELGSIATSHEVLVGIAGCVLGIGSLLILRRLRTPGFVVFANPLSAP